MRTVKTDSFVLLNDQDGFTLSVVASCGKEKRIFEHVGYTPQICIDEIETQITLYFETFFKFGAPHHIIFSLN